MLTEWIHQAGDRYVITGFYVLTGRRFRTSTSNPHVALNINLWRGRVWLVRDGRRRLVKRVP